MRYLLALIALALGLGFAGPPLYYAHAVTTVPAVIAGVCIAFAFYLADSERFVAFGAELRKDATCWFKKGEST